MTRTVVITGVGAVTPLGVGARTLHERWSAGQSGIEDGYGRATEFEPKEHLSIKEVRRAFHDAVMASVPAHSRRDLVRAAAVLAGSATIG